jgi:hypothetical protein
VGIGPRGSDGHGATQKAAFAGLELFINFVVNDHGKWIGRLGCVPVRFSFVQLAGQCQLKPPLADGLFESALPARLAESDQNFFPFTARRAWNTSWMMLLSFSGERAISSEAAATTIQKAGCWMKSMENRNPAGSLAVLEKSSGACNSFHRYISGSDCWVWTIASRMANT